MLFSIKTKSTLLNFFISCMVLYTASYFSYQLRPVVAFHSALRKSSTSHGHGKVVFGRFSQQSERRAISLASTSFFPISSSSSTTTNGKYTNRDMKLSSYTSASNDDKDKTDEKEEKSEKKEGAAAESKGGGHSVPGGAPPDPELVAIQQKVMEHQKTAVKLGGAVEAKTLIQWSSGIGTLSTNSIALDGYPASATVGFGLDDYGRPIFSLSGISTHKQDLVDDPCAAFSVQAKNFAGLDDGRLALIGDVTKVPEEETKKAREQYLAKHPGHFWVDFGDFDFFRMDKIVAVRYNGGFARFGAFTPEEYMEAKADPVGEYADKVTGHMNDDHSNATVAMIKHYIGLDVDTAIITAMDSLGMFVKVNGKYGSSKLRLPFPRPATDRADIKTLIVEMTQASAKSM